MNHTTITLTALQHLKLALFSIVLTFAPNFAAAQACVPPPSGLVSWWRADATAKDSMGSNHGTLLNGAKHVSGQVGRAFAFDGVDDVVSIPDAPSLNFTPSSSFTIELWALRTSSAPTMHLVGKRNGCGGAPFYQIAIGPGAIPSESVPTNVWTHVAVTYDGASGLQRQYVNGGLVASSNASSFVGSNSAPLLIGGSGTCTPFGGFIDEVSVYNRALLAAELQAISSAGGDGKCNSSLPVCDVRLNRTTYLSGDQIVAQVARLTNPTSTALSVEVKLWFEQLGGASAAPFLTVGADGAFVLPPGFDTDFGPLQLATVQALTARGTYKFNCRVLHAVTGELLAEDFNLYEVR